MQSWVDEAGVDGFNLTPESYEDFIDLVIPQLQARGVYKTSYAEGTLREKLFDGKAHVLEQHAGAAFRHPGAQPE